MAAGATDELFPEALYPLRPTEGSGDRVEQSRGPQYLSREGCASAPAQLPRERKGPWGSLGIRTSERLNHTVTQGLSQAAHG